MARPFEEQSAAIDIKLPALKTEGPALSYLFIWSLRAASTGCLVTNAALVPPARTQCGPMSASTVNNKPQRRSGRVSNQHTNSTRVRNNFMRTITASCTQAAYFTITTSSYIFLVNLTRVTDIKTHPRLLLA